MLTKGTHY